mmetsp:Transcript_86475/g.244309  ORF Transcript_86475/g.244309 Transcript_86475/m.244309 type:complete len:159 (-) Transcript_86475:849-1325(-)
MHAPQFLTSFGEQIVVLNSIISTKSVCNHSRSPSPWLKITVELPTRTRPPDVAKFVGAVQKFINDRENDWTSVFIFITGFDADRATMKLDVWLGATNPYQEWNALYSSRSRVLLYVHITTYAITTTAHQSNISLTVHWPLTSHWLLTGYSQIYPRIHC